MSYILDALKKSEQERGHGNIPGVQTVHSSSLSYRNEKNVYWPYLLITAVVINIALVLYFIFDKEPGVTSQVEVTGKTSAINTLENNIAKSNGPSISDTIAAEQKTIISPTADEQSEANIIKPEPAATRAETHEVTTVSTENQSKSDTFAAKDTRTSNLSKEDNTTVIDFHSLSDSVKQQLPAIIISAHVYSSNPLQRSIVINNNFMEEGEYVLDNLRLHEITPGGAIFDHNGTRFSYSVISSWQ